MNQGRFNRPKCRPRICQHAIGFCVFTVLSLIGAPSSADIATDGTVGPVQTLAGPNFSIGTELGAIRGTNLFHSFQTFNIHIGESATFTGPNSIDNVISRVTGGKISTINGLLRSEVGHADVYFINPSGVVFGPNAQVDVPGAFHVSTADELRFEDGVAYNATDAGASTLSLAQPASFGFLSPQPTSITVNGSQLEFVPNSRESLSAGNVTIQGGARLVSDGGDIRITAVGESEDAVHLAAGPADFAGSGTVAISESSTIDVSGTEGSETVALRGGLVEIADSVVAADHRGNENAGGQILLEADSVRVINSDIRARVFGEGRGNDIVVVAEDLVVDAATAPDGRSRLTTRVMPGASGAAGDVKVEVADVTLTNGGQLSSFIEDGAMGRGGTVKVQAGNTITIEGSNETGFHSGILTITLGVGNSGSVTIEANELHILDEGAVWTFTQGSGAGGNVTITANHSMLMDKAEIDTSSYDTGTAGHILLIADELSLLNDSEILADTYSSGAAGNIGIEVSGSISLDNYSAIEAATGDTGPAGQVVIEAGDLRLLSGSSIIASTLGAGAAGTLNIDVEGSFLIDDYSFISSGNVLGKGSGTTGSLRVTANNLKILNGGLIENITLGDGDAPPIVIEVTDLMINGGGKLTGILSDTDLGSGKGGDIRVTATGQLELFNGGLISSNTRDEGNAGAVCVEATDLVINGGGADQAGFTGIYSDARNSLGTGGDVQVKVKERLEILHGGQISSSTMGGQADAGTVNVQAAELVIDGEDQLISTGILGKANGVSDGSSGDAGDVSVTVTDRLEIHNGGKISTSVELGEGNAGTVRVTATDVLIDGQDSGIFSSTIGGLTGILSGVSGEVQVTTTQRMELRNAGQISTSSGVGGGDAGAVTVKASELEIKGRNSGIISKASIGSLGQAGSVLITAQGLEMVDQGQISVASAALLSDEEIADKQTPQITVTAPNIHFTQSAMITAESTGNVPAGAIGIHAGELLLEGESRITTESADADGGPIGISGQNIIMRDSLITTSVGGATGDGGNITINADALVLQGGFIQANTAAYKARGGDIFLDTNALVASYGLLEVGGTERLAFQSESGRNVIQAAAPGGAYGTITITSPELDIGGALVTLSTRFADVPRLISDPCVAASGQTASSLIQCGRGGLPAGPEQPAAVFFGGERLDRLLDTDAGQTVTDPQTSGESRSPTSGQRGR
jgi:filamentous hemagglutinin family protein